MSCQNNIDALSVGHPDNMCWVQPKRCPNVCRELLILRPQSNTYATNGDNCIRFVLPKQNSDWRRSFLKFDVTITKTGGTYARLSQLAASMIDRVRWFNGDVEEQYEYYNRIQNMIMNSEVNHDVIQSIGYDYMGYGTQSDRNAWGASPSSEYVIPINIGIFGCPVLPLGIIGGQSDFNVELWLANPLSFVETDGSNPVVTVTNIRWEYDHLWSTDLSYERLLASDVASGNMTIGYPAWSCFQTPVLNTLNDLQITWRGNSLDMIKTILVDQSSVNNTLISDKFTTWRKLNGGASVYSYQTQLKDGYWSPVEAVSCADNATEAFFIYLKSIGRWDVNAQVMFSAPIDSYSYNYDSFLMVNDYTSVPATNTYSEPTTQPFYFNNLSTLKQSQNTLFRLTLTAVPPPQLVAYHFVKYGSLLRISPNGSLTRST